jgi:hypothetical protein
MLYISNETESNYEQNARKHKNDKWMLCFTYVKFFKIYSSSGYYYERISSQMACK